MKKSKLKLLITLSVMSMIWIIIITQFNNTIISEVTGIKEIKIIVMITACVPLAIFLVYLIRSLYLSERMNWIFEAVARENSHNISLYLIRYGYGNIEIYGYIGRRIKEISEKSYANKLNLINTTFDEEKIENIMHKLNCHIISLQKNIPESKYPAVYKFYYTCIKSVITEFFIQNNLKGYNSFNESIAYCLTLFKRGGEDLTEYYGKAIDMIVSLPWATKENLTGIETEKTVNDRIDQITSKLVDISPINAEVLIKNLISTFNDHRGTDSAFGSKVIYI
jgi:hypothetical protein